MALQTISGGGINWPNVLVGGATYSSYTGLSTLDASGEYEAIVYRADQNMTISHVGYRTHTTATNSPKIEVRIETVDAATGLPTGTLWGTNTNILSATLSANTWYLDALTASASVTKDDVFAVVFKWGEVATSSVNLAYVTNYPIFSGAHSMPCRVANTGTPAKAQGWTFAAALGSSSTSFYNMPMMIPASSLSSSSANSTNSQAIALKFSLPFKCRIKGMLFTDQPTDAKDFSVVLYDDAGSDVGSTLRTFDTSQVRRNTAGVTICAFTNPYIITPNTWYKAALVPTTTTNQFITHYAIPSADYNTAMPWGTHGYLSTRSTTTWTDTTTAFPEIDLWIDQLDDGVAPSFSTFVG